MKQGEEAGGDSSAAQPANQGWMPQWAHPYLGRRTSRKIRRSCRTCRSPRTSVPGACRKRTKPGRDELGHLSFACSPHRSGVVVMSIRFVPGFPRRRRGRDLGESRRSARRGLGKEVLLGNVTSPTGCLNGIQSCHFKRTGVRASLSPFDRDELLSQSRRRVPETPVRKRGVHHQQHGKELRLVELSARQDKGQDASPRWRRSLPRRASRVPRYKCGERAVCRS